MFQIWLISDEKWERYRGHKPKSDLNWKLIDAHARLPLPVLLAIKHGLWCHMCDLHSKYQKDHPCVYSRNNAISSCMHQIGGYCVYIVQSFKQQKKLCILHAVCTCGAWQQSRITSILFSVTRRRFTSLDVANDFQRLNFLNNGDTFDYNSVTLFVKYSSQNTLLGWFYC